MISPKPLPEMPQRSDAGNVFNRVVAMATKFFHRHPPVRLYAIEQRRAAGREQPVTRLSLLPQPSRTTFPGFLSSRNPRKTGARNFPSRVHSANLISATNFGLTQCIFFIMEGVIP
jgi:hypothetical protein